MKKKYAMTQKDPVVAHIPGCYFRLSENWIHTQIKYLQAWRPIVLAQITQNLDTVSWTPSHIARLECLPTPIRKFDSLLYRWLRFSPAHYATARWYDARLLHAHFGMRGWAALPLSRALDVPLITTFYGYDLSRLPVEEPHWRGRYQELFAEGACFLVEGPHMAEQLASLGCPRRKIQVHHLGVSMEDYAYRERTPINEDGLRILMAGRLVEKKGFDDALMAFASFVRQGGRGTLTIVGDNPHYDRTTDIKTQLQGIASRYGIEDRVAFWGLIPHKLLHQAYYDHHVFMASSRTASDGDNEGGAPVTLIEAQATGMPVVGTTHCDIPEVVHHGHTGLLAPEGDIVTITEHLMMLYRNPERIQAMAWGARRRMCARYNARKQGKALETIYDRVRKKDKATSTLKFQVPERIGIT